MVATARHLLLSVPDNWSNDQRGQFFERFVADILRPLRFTVHNRIRVTGSQLGVLRSHRSEQKQFLGGGTSEALVRLLGKLHSAKQGVAESELVEDGLRNAVYDALALELGDRLPDGRIALRKRHPDLKKLSEAAKTAMLGQPVIRLVAEAVNADSAISNAALGEKIKAALQADWKPASALRYANGLRGYYAWAKS